MISVVVVCRNPGRSLDHALDSVSRQSFHRFELVVIDGGSTDGTAARLESRRADLSHCVSEPDQGVYQAMNKGIAAARGEWILFLGADDRLANDRVLEETAAVLATSPAGVAAGAARYADGRIYRFTPPIRAARRNFLHHQAAFFRRSVFALHGGFDERLEVAADYDMNLRLWKAGTAFTPLIPLISECGVGGLSDAGRWVSYREEIAVRHRHLPLARCVLWDLLAVVRYVRKQVIRRRRHA